MNESLISLISILLGVISTNLYAYVKRKKYFNFTGNSILGVFGSVLFTKSLTYLGINPMNIMISGALNFKLLILNFTISIFGAILIMLLFKKIYIKINTGNTKHI